MTGHRTPETETSTLCHQRHLQLCPTATMQGLLLGECSPEKLPWSTLLGSPCCVVRNLCLLKCLTLVFPGHSPQPLAPQVLIVGCPVLTPPISKTEKVNQCLSQMVLDSRSHFSLRGRSNMCKCVANALSVLLEFSTPLLVRIH